MLKSPQFSDRFDMDIFILLLLSLMHSFAILFNIGLPLGVIYGPLIYLSYKKEIGKVTYSIYYYLHFFPFFLLFCMYLLNVMDLDQTGYFSILYYRMYFISMALSLLVYSIITGLTQQDKQKPVDASKEKLIGWLNFITGCISLFLVFTLITMFNVGSNEFGFDPKLIVYGLIMTCVLLMLYYLLIESKKSAIVTLPERKDSTIKKHLPYMEQNEFIIRVKQALEESELYLNANLTLEMLAEKLDIPKHHVSPLLNLYFGKNFYQLIAEYRIEYAKKRLEEDITITIESLAYECGFHSKTSLNKYFKEFTGIVPSQYRNEIESTELSREFIFR